MASFQVEPLHGWMWDPMAARESTEGIRIFTGSTIMSAMDDKGDAANQESAPALDRLLFSAKEVAHSLSISTTTLRQITRQGDLRCVQIGYRTLYRRQDVEAFVNSLVEPRH